MIDFGPLLEKPWLMLFGAAAQFRDSRAELILHLSRLPASIISKRRVLRNGSVFNPRTQSFNRRSSAV